MRGWIISVKELIYVQGRAGQIFEDGFMDLSQGGWHSNIGDMTLEKVAIFTYQVAQ